MSYQDKIWRWWSAPPSWEIMNDREALLKYELSLIHKAMQEETQPIIKELCDIEATKPIKLMHIESMLLNTDALAAITIKEK